MKKKQFTVDYFIKKFEAIPEKRWTILAWTKAGFFGFAAKHCTMGHCGESANNYTEEGQALRRFCNIHLSQRPEAINDHGAGGFFQLTPKQRILAALYKIKSLTTPKVEHKDITSELASFPIDETLDLKIMTHEFI